VLRKKAENIFKYQHEGDQENRKRGLLLHAVFSRIQYAHDCDVVFQQAVQDGLLSKEELPPVQAQFNDLLKSELIRSWFDASWDVRTEVPILAPNKADVRVDRIMLKEDQAVVIDYKTGEPRPSDEEQVAAYMKILYEMKYVHVEGYLLYVNSGHAAKVELVHANKKSANNQNQLGLEL
jgi:ATP-dependent helicase/nuclease subunit A